MNLNLDISAVTRFFRGILNEFREKKLWPIAAVLLAGIVAVPVLLTSSSNAPAQSQTPAPVPPPPTGTTLPALSVQSTPSRSNLSGPARNPFGSASGASTGGSSTSTPNLADVAGVATLAHNAVNALTGSNSSSGGSSVGSSSSSNTSTTSSSTTSSSTSSSSTSSSNSSSSSTPPSITGNSKPKPAPSGLKSTQAYQVSLSVTDGNGVDAVDSLKRLSGIPSDAHPLLTELGVEQGGSHVLFVVQPGTVVAGPGSCTPGPLDCEILSLGQDQTEAVGNRVGTIGSSEQTLFAVTGVTAADYPSSAAAAKARREVSSAGQALLNNSTLPALSLFQYEPSLGYVVDLRNLTVGG
jgi:hypothetical protein